MKNLRLLIETIVKEHVFNSNVIKQALKNKNFRKVIHTTDQSQITVMSIPPDGEIGQETHEKVEQQLYFVSGKGIAVINGKKKTIKPGDVFIVTPGMTHNFINNSSKEPLKLFSIYTPPNHIDGRVHKTKEDSDNDKEDHDFEHDQELKEVWVNFEKSVKEFNNNILEYQNSKQNINELAVNLSQAENQQLCLSVIRKGTNIRIYLYNGDALFGYIKAKTSGQKIDPDSYKEIIYGAITILQNQFCGGFHVTTSAAQHGYGPLMYDLAASLVYPNFIMSDRDSTSAEARNVWKFMLKNRLNDFEVQPLGQDCKSKQTDMLNYKFKIKNPLNPDKLIQNAQNVLNDIQESTGHNQGYTLDKIKDLGVLLFASSVKDD